MAPHSVFQTAATSAEMKAMKKENLTGDPMAANLVAQWVVW